MNISEKFIHKIFFKKVIFKIIVVLTFFLSLTIFILFFNTYHNPYISETKYENFVVFVDKNLKNGVVRDYLNSGDFYYLYTKQYEDAFVKQAINKGIISIEPFYLYSKHNIIEPVLACDKDKLENFKNEYRFVNGIDFKPYTGKDVIISVDCKKATTIPLAPENYYFIKKAFIPNVILSFVGLPLAILILWLILRFIIISPILWIFHKD